MNNFFVAIFINDKVCQYKVDELIQNSLNGYVNENFVFHKRNIYLPVQIQGSDYCLQKKVGADLLSMLPSASLEVICKEKGGWLK